MTGATRGEARPAIVVGGEVNAISVVRSLARVGVPVTVLGPALAHSGLRHSRRVAEYVRFTDKEAIQDDWLAWLERERSGAVLLPCDDDALELIGRNRAQLVDLGYTPFEADDDVLLAMLDKGRTFELAQAAGIPAPLTIPLEGPDDLDRAVSELTFPLALKPLHAHRFGRHRSVKLIRVESEEELRREHEPLRALGLEMAATEVVVGASDECRSYFSYVDESGAPLFHFTKRKLRQQPSRFGLGCFQVSEWDAEVAELGLRFFQGVGLRGLACVEFKRDVRDGQLKLIECNHRFSDANELVRAAGLDLAVLTYNLLVGRPPPALGRGRDGIALWFPVEDARALLEYRRRGELGIREWLRSLARPLRFPFFRLDDPAPTIANASWLAARAVRKARRELAR